MTKEKEVLSLLMKMRHIYLEVELFSWTAYLIIARGNSLNSAAYTWVLKVRTLHGKHIYPVMLALLPDKKETAVQYAG